MTTIRRLMAFSVIGILAFAGIANAQTGRFADDDGNPHEPNIEAIAAAGITTGCTDVLYCPADAVTRAEMAVFLIRALGTESFPAYTGTFSDVPESAWYSAHVELLAALGITTGYADGTYRPADSVSRAEMAAFIVRATSNTPAPYTGSFSDVGADAWYADYVQSLLNLEITQGCAVGLYCPNDAVTRDQMASFIARAFNLAPITPAPPPSEITFGSGTWRIGADIPYGTYRNSDSSSGCYAARLSGFGGTLDEIIANEFTSNIAIVTLASTDAGFESTRCGTWSNDLTPRVNPLSDRGAGYFFVSEEMAPGLWRNSDSSQGCYWERLSGFSWRLSDIIANGFDYSIQTVEIKSSDVGFSSNSCGTWTRLGE